MAYNVHDPIDKYLCKDSLGTVDENKRKFSHF